MIEPKNYKKYIAYSGIALFIGIWIALTFLSECLYILGMMIIIFVASICIVSSFKATDLTLKKKLIIQTIIYLNWFLQFELSATMICVSEFGFNFLIILLYLPAIIISVVLCITKAHNLKKGKKFNDFPWAILTGIPVAGGIVLGRSLGGKISDFIGSVSGRSYNIIFIVILVMLSCFFTIGVYNIQKLFYLKKYNINENI